MTDKYKIGDKVGFYCSRCRTNLWGNVMAVNDDGSVAKVTCRTCRSQQPYKPERSPEEERKRLLKKAMRIRDRRRQQVSEVEESRKVPTTGGDDVTARWREATEDVNTFATLPYNKAKTYKMGDTLNHNEHGLGIVQEVLHENAILVLFRKVEIPLEMNVQPESD